MGTATDSGAAAPPQGSSSQAPQPVNYPQHVQPQQPSSPMGATQDFVLQQQGGVYIQHGALPPQQVAYQYTAQTQQPQQPQNPADPPPYNQPQSPNPNFSQPTFTFPPPQQPGFIPQQPQPGFFPQQPGFQQPGFHQPVGFAPIQAAYIHPIQPVRQGTDQPPDEKKPVEVNVSVVNQAQATSAVSQKTAVGDAGCSAGCIMGMCLACCCCNVM